LDFAQLQGADFTGANLENASLQEVCVWRTEPPGSEGQTRNTLVSLEDPAICGDGSGTYLQVRNLILNQLHPGDIRDADLNQIVAITKSSREKMPTLAWSGLAKNAPAYEIFEQTYKEHFLTIGCSSVDDPSVLHGLIPQLKGRFPEESATLREIAAAILDYEKCPTARMLSDDDRMALESLIVSQTAQANAAGQTAKTTNSIKPDSGTQVLPH
jgi:hypothetical protein